MQQRKSLITVNRNYSYNKVLWENVGLVANHKSNTLPPTNFNPYSQWYQLSFQTWPHQPTDVHANKEMYTFSVFAKYGSEVQYTVTAVHKVHKLCRL